jgi:hypothetical protein
MTGSQQAPAERWLPDRTTWGSPGRRVRAPRSSSLSIPALTTHLTFRLSRRRSHILGTTSNSTSRPPINRLMRSTNFFVQWLATDRKPSNQVHVRSGSFASFWPRIDHIRSTLINGHRRTAPACRVGATTRQRYSITSSARESSDGGTVRPSALAVFMLITSSNLVGCSTGRSEGLAL